MYYFREHASGYWVEPEVVPLDEPTVAVARAAMEALVGHRPRDPGRATLAADGAQVRDVRLDGDILVADFSGLVGGGGLGSGYEAALVQQIAHTGAQFDSVRAVRILVDGQQVESLAGHVDISEPGEPSPFALSPITFTTHTSGDTVRAGDVTVGGEACTFEATVLLTATVVDAANAPLELAAGEITREGDAGFTPILVFTNRQGVLSSEGLRPGRRARGSRSGRGNQC